MKRALQHLKIINKNDYWETPKAEYAYAVWNYDVTPALDVCASEQNRRCEMYFTEEDNALTQQWNQDFFMNPPYSQINTWMKYAYEQHKKHNVNALILTFGKIGVKWFHEFVYDRTLDIWKAEFKPVDHRIKFTLNGIVPKNCKICKKSFYDVEHHTCPQCTGQLTDTSAPYDSSWIIFRKKEKSQ